MEDKSRGAPRRHGPHDLRLVRNDEDAPIRPGEPPTGQQHPDDAFAVTHRFPVVALIAPGSFCLLFAAGGYLLVNMLNSVWQGMTIATLALLGAVACFGVIAAKTTNQHGRIACAIAVAAGIFGYLGSLMRII